MVFLCILIFTLLFIALSGFLIGVSLNYIEFTTIQYYLSQFYGDLRIKVIIFFVGILLFLLWIWFLQGLFIRREREKNIAFQTEKGEVVISLGAVEDFLKKVCAEISEIRDLRPIIRAKRKGKIYVELRLVLNPIEELPDFTSNLQNLVKEKLQTLLGTEDIRVRIFVSKILSLKKKREGKEDNKTEPELKIPYREF